MTPLLLDSNALLWAVLDSPRLGKAARKTMRERAGAIFFSHASIWELAIKSASGKLRLEEDFAEAAESAGFSLLPLTAQHCWQAAHLPRHHADPFDRLMVAQAEIEKLAFVTSDKILAIYGITVIDAGR